MSNMGYCRMRNTLGDLRDCYDNMDTVVNDDEIKAREQLVTLCQRIANDYGHEYGDKTL